MPVLVLKFLSEGFYTGAGIKYLKTAALATLIDLQHNRQIKKTSIQSIFIVNCILAHLVLY